MGKQLKKYVLSFSEAKLQPEKYNIKKRQNEK